MPLETATYINQLVSSNPAHTDGLSQADSHARLTKAALLATFPNFTAAALTSTQAQIDAAVSQSLGTAAHRFPLGTAALPGLTPVGDPDTGFWSPAANQLAASLAGVQVFLMGGTALVTTLGIAAAAVASTGAYSGGTGQLVPIGAVLEWYDDVLPTEGGYVWANGQAISRAAYPILWARWGTRFGAGDGSTTFNVPDRRDTVAVGKSTMGGVASRGLHTLTNTVLGTLIGLANTVLVTLNLPPYTPAGSIAVVGNVPILGSTPYNNTFVGGSQLIAVQNNGTTPLVITSQTFTGTAQGGTSTAFNNVQPSTTANFILRAA